MFDRVSPVWKRLSEGLTSTHKNLNFNRVSKEQGFELYKGTRGSPENIGNEFEASHPVVRTNPVTGWKSLFAAGAQIRHGWIDNVTDGESDIIKAYFLQLITENHDLQVRFRWNKNDIAIWDNRSVFHTATFDYRGKRQGNRVVSIREKPFYDSKSVSRREALGLWFNIKYIS
ncbi:putative alpha-ketoglutarate-dependent sulfonate dioxygenase [Lachnellula willkommii]|uniref:Putative alpha-ketoglutarate-dependent sulfonate dioxygenase n=1 Tax=Lachnellula willkommii TaxID=215461 RepID=A0A559M415_9HELO|nr:putative alpha-ketoglutarate-dependent sulfonate dioxygenase [Lachnellula willkommii]